MPLPTVYTPWFRSWVAYVHAHPETLRAYAAPEPNPPGTLEREWEGLRAAGEIPEAPEEKRLAEAERLRALWPAGEAEAHRRLDKFCRERIARYADRRDRPAEAATSSLSVHLAAGTLSARAAVRAARECSGADRLDAGDEGARTWIGEVAWRDFYRHVLVHWPYVCMNKPFKPEYSNMEWSYDAEHFAAWREGRTGFPIVDAAMRQMRGTGWMHNRCRMIAASFLAKDLLLDWRMGERFFMESLIDGDFASNSGGWGFGASVGVDPQPYFRIFNPLLQSEKFDPDGAYIRKWVPELRAVEGKAIHDPYGRGAAAQAKKMGYPEPIVNHKESRERALSVYKAAQEKDKS
ncbi:DNA photolyase, FAD-binding/Cryptochrome [Biscogniauxia sp. FL1348]|nr:DNA photolyase, FAD-binding/Cryptochrome [Biscogniauxia sp. FL1348]